MKKKLLISLIILTCIFSAGFRGCNYFEIVFNIMAAAGYATGKYHSTLDNTDNLYGIVVGEEGKISTSEGRPPVPWFSRNSGTVKNLNAVKILDRTDSTVAYTVGDSGTVLRSSDKGQTWQNRNIQYSNPPDLYGLDFLPVQQGSFAHVVVVGRSGSVLRSENFGSYWNWFQYPPLTGRHFRSVVVITQFIWVIVGSGGAVYRTTNSGETFQGIPMGDTTSFNKIVQVRYDTYLIAGNNGKIYMSTNYGSSWSSRSSGTTKNLRDALFKNEFEGVVVGDDGTVRYTSNGGATWGSDPYLSGLTVRDIAAVSKVDSLTANSITRNFSAADNPADNTTSFLAVSSEPFLGIEPISNIIADHFSLKQNYPNPFNPETKIRFDVPANVNGRISNVNITIYEITGKEISILVNEQLMPGEYEVNWNGSRYPSGVYFYRIITEEFTETKKMILVK
jgi:photosystem II stability/assembly factor-like uncharacterized protein